LVSFIFFRVNRAVSRAFSPEIKCDQLTDLLYITVSTVLKYQKQKSNHHNKIQLRLHHQWQIDVTDSADVAKAAAVKSNMYFESSQFFVFENDTHRNCNGILKKYNYS